MDYKQDIINSRVGCVGSSDGAMLQRIAKDGSVPKSYAKRMAIIKGIIPSVDGHKTRQMELGDIVEGHIFSLLSSRVSGYESNPKWESETYRRKNVRLICHPDITRYDDENHILFVYEVKTTRFSVDETMETYMTQMFIENELAKEQIRTLDGDWEVRLSLVHYQTDGTGVIDEFNPENVTIVPVKFPAPPFNLAQAMDILDETLETFTYDTEEMDVEQLPDYVQSGLYHMSLMMDEIKKREDQISEFKAQLYAFMCEHNIKSVRNDYFSVTRVDPSTATSFDGKAYLRDLHKTDPTLADEIEAKYKKTTSRGGYALVKTK